jgi:hypothetical protein
VIRHRGEDISYFGRGVVQAKNEWTGSACAEKTVVNVSYSGLRLSSPASGQTAFLGFILLISDLAAWTSWTAVV